MNTKTVHDSFLINRFLIQVRGGPSTTNSQLTYQRLFFSGFPFIHSVIHSIGYFWGSFSGIFHQFVWLTDENLQNISKRNDTHHFSRFVPTLVGYESILALKEVAVLMNLSITDIEDVFFNNAKNIETFQQKSFKTFVFCI